MGSEGAACAACDAHDDARPLLFSSCPGARAAFAHSNHACEIPKLKKSKVEVSNDGGGLYNPPPSGGGGGDGAADGDDEQGLFVDMLRRSKAIAMALRSPRSRSQRASRSAARAGSRTTT